MQSMRRETQLKKGPCENTTLAVSKRANLVHFSYKSRFRQQSRVIKLLEIKIATTQNYIFQRWHEYVEQSCGLHWRFKSSLVSSLTLQHWLNELKNNFNDDFEKVVLPTTDNASVAAQTGQFRSPSLNDSIFLFQYSLPCLNQLEGKDASNQVIGGFLKSRRKRKTPQKVASFTSDKTHETPSFKLFLHLFSRVHIPIVTF